MKAVQLLVNSKLPKELKDYSRTLDAKGIGELMRRVASEYPDQYEDIVQHISDIGRNASYEQGETISLKDFRPVFDRDALLKRMDRDIAMARARFKDDEEFQKEREKIWGKYTAEIEREVARNGIAKGNNLAYSIVSGARGKPAQLKAMQATPGIYQDSRGKTIPMFVRHSLAEGLRPAEYAAGFFGARQSVISTKRCLCQNTMVCMSSGVSVRIQDIRVGDFVRGSNLTGDYARAEVIDVIDQGIQEVFTWVFSDPDGTAKIIEATDNHKILIKDTHGNIQLTPLKAVMDESMLVCELENCRLLSKCNKRQEHCYDLSVENEDHLFVLANGIIVSNSTAKGGDLSKQLAQTGANIVVTSNDCKSHNGRLLSIDDDSMRGRVLAQDTGPYKAGTLISKGVLEDIKRDTNIKELVVRSPMTCDNKDGICAKCAGAYWNGRRFPRVGDAIGITAANAIGEPITQMALNCIEEGTPVAMEDGTWKSIEEIEVGDRVKTADVDGNVHVSAVTHVFDQGVQKVWDWIFQRHGVGSKTIPATNDHKVLLRDTKTQKTIKLPLKKATRMHEIVTSCQEEHFSFYKKVRCREVHCYDIEVDCPSHLFVLANGAVVSNSKHTGGITGAKKEYSGFEVINQLVQSPEQFPDRATVAEEDGTVTNIIDAPQGGKYVIVGQKKNYVPHGYPVTVSIGDTVEAGDALSEGIVDPGDVVKYKGLGQGRLYWADRLKDALDASGMQAMRINTEILARNAIDHVEVDDPEGAGDALPGDVVSYNKLRWTYKPDEELVQAKLPSQAVGKYLQEPVLHYSIGTRITPQVLKRLSAAKLDARPYAVSEQPPGFTADMQRLRTASHVNDDFLASMSTSYLSSQLNHAATRGLETDLKSNVHYAPRLAYGEGFGEETRTTGKF